MAIKNDTYSGFSGRIDPADAGHPFGKFKDRSTPGTGTPYKADKENDYEAFFQKLLVDAGTVPNGTPDTTLASQYHEALVEKINIEHSKYTVANIPELQASMASGKYSQGDLVDVLSPSGPSFQIYQGAGYTHDYGLTITETGGTTAVGEFAAVRVGVTSVDAEWFIGAVNKLDAAIQASYGKVLYLTQPSYDLPAYTIEINSPITILGCSQGTTVLNKTLPVGGIHIKSSNVTIQDVQMSGVVVLDTSFGIKIGQNDGANGQGAGYISAAQATLRNVFINDCGDYNIDWEEGPFAVFDNVHSFDSNINNFYVSPNSFDASHGKWYTNSAGAGGSGYNIEWGCHKFILAKSFSDNSGFYLDKVRGSTGHIFVELSTNEFLEFGPNTLANELEVAFWTAGKNYIDAGVGNKLKGMSLGNNNGGSFETFTRTNQLLIKNEFVPVGGTVYNGGLGISQTSDNDFTLGNSAYVCKLNSTSAGVALKGAATHSKIFDITGSGTVALSDTNQHISDWLVSDTETLQLNGAGGTAYTPFDGQTVTVWLKGSGTASIYGQIGGALTTETITTTNTSKTYTYQAAQGYWFRKNTG